MSQQYHIVMTSKGLKNEEKKTNRRTKWKKIIGKKIHGLKIWNIVSTDKYLLSKIKRSFQGPTP